MSRAAQTENVFIDGPAGRLEAILEMPADLAVPTAAAVVCHPHPLHQGTMTNKVAHTLARSFVDLGVPVVRFNFRGVGRSDGEFANAVGETEDALAVLAWMESRWPGKQRWLGGFSFGAQVALNVSQRRELDWLVTVAPPVERMQLADFRVPSCPWLLVQGGADDVVDPAGVTAWADSLQPGPAFVRLADVGHFFHGHLTELREIVKRHQPRTGGEA